MKEKIENIDIKNNLKNKVEKITEKNCCQNNYFFEFDGARNRKVYVQIISK